MKVVLASLPSSIPNGDSSVFATTRATVLVEGVKKSAAEGSGCKHDTAWFVSRLGIALLEQFTVESGKPPPISLAQAITNVSALHLSTCNIYHPGNPAAEVAVLVERDQVFEYLICGTAAILIDGGHSFRVIRDNRLTAKADALGKSPLMTEDNRGNASELVHGPECGEPSAEWWTVSGDPSGAEDVTTGTVERPSFERAAIVGRTLARRIEDSRFLDFHAALALLKEGGPDALISRVKETEQFEMYGHGWNQMEMHGPASIVFCQVYEARN